MEDLPECLSSVEWLDGNSVNDRELNMSNKLLSSTGAKHHAPHF